MASSYDNDLRLEEMGTGEQIGSWGTTTNTNLSLIAEAFSYQTEATFSSDADVTATIADGASDKVRAFYLKVTSSATLSATRTLTIAPNTLSKVIFIENATSGAQSINISQGSGANVTVGNGLTKACILDGGGSGAVVHDMFDKIDLGANAKLNGGDFGVTASSTTTFTNKTFDANGTGNSISNIENADISASVTIAFSKMANLTINRALSTDSNGDIQVSNITSDELNYLDGLSSNIQGQINNKLNAAIPTNTWITSSEGDQRLYYTNSTDTYFKADGSHIFRNASNSTTADVDSSGNFTAQGNVGAYSDLALKEDIYVIENALDKVKKLRGVHFTKKSNKSKEIGVVANEVEKVVPELVDEYEDEQLGTVKTMKYANTVGLLIEAVKDLSKQIEELKMALPTSGNLTLNQIHVEAGGSSGSACTLNDTDIRGLNAASGYTIPTTSGSAIEIGDFYGASQTLSFVINNGSGAYTGGGASQYRTAGWAIPGFHSKITTNLGSISSGSTSSSAFGGNAVASAYATHHNLTGNVYIYVWIYGSQSNTDSVFRGFSVGSGRSRPNLFKV